VPAAQAAPADALTRRFSYAESCMTASIALAALLTFAPAQGAGVSVNNVRLTYRDLGPTRPDAKYLPGDVVFISFDIEGLKVNDSGEVTYSMGMELLDKVGKAISSFPPTKASVSLPLGGNRLPGNVFFAVDQGMTPGIYTCKVTIADGSTPSATKTIEQKFEVLPKDFGLVALYVSRDEQGQLPVGMSGIAGQTVYVQVGLVHLGRDAGRKPDAAVEMRVLDSAGQPTTKKPIVAVVPRTLPEADHFVAFTFPLALNHEGEFKVEIKAADKVTGKNATLTFPIKVYPASK
jgi:hypothetical protein